MSPSSLQEDIRRQRMHRLFEPRSKAALRLAESPSSLQQKMRRHWTHHLLALRASQGAVQGADARVSTASDAGARASQSGAKPGRDSRMCADVVIA